MKVNTHNQYFNNSWEYLFKYHDPDIGQEPHWAAFPNTSTLDMGIKPKISHIEWPQYVNAITNVLTIGRRNNLLKIQVDGKGFQVFWTIDKKYITE